VLLGPFLHSLEVSELSQCSSAIKRDPITFGISCVKNLLEHQEIMVEHSTDIARLKRDAAAVSHSLHDTNFDMTIIFNATLLTMHTGNPQADLIPNGVLVVRGGVIDSVGAGENTIFPNGVALINAQGGQS